VETLHYLLGWEDLMNSREMIMAATFDVGLVQLSTPMVAKVISSGTGFVINDQDYLLTNNHVVTYDAKMKDGKRYAGPKS